jgi:hypothetical protein
MGRILNFAILSGNSEMSEEFYNIYQSWRKLLKFKDVKRSSKAFKYVWNGF